jgi:hypothetical protein
MLQTTLGEGEMSFQEWILLLSPWLALLGLILWDSHSERTTKIVVAEKGNYERALVVWTAVLGFSTIALVAATTISALILHRTDDAIHRQLEVLERDEQPYVGLAGEMSDPEYDSKMGRIFWNFSFRNSGRRAANGFSIKKYMKINEGKFSELPSVLAQSGSLGPNESLFLTVFSEPVTLAQFQTLLKQKQGITALVEFKYTDPLGRQLSSAFCVAYDPMAIGILNPDVCKGEIGR